MGKDMKERRKHTFKHRSYLEAISDRIVTMLPTRDIVFNSLLAIYETAFSEGYQTRIEDSVFFKAKREEHRKNSWEKIITNIDDLIHNRPTKQSNNQPKK